MITARISNINSTTTREDLQSYLALKGLPVAPGQRGLAFTETEGGGQRTTVSFADKTTFKRALALPMAERMLGDREIIIDDDFDGFTVLSEGIQIDIVALHGLNGHAIRSWEYHDRGTTFMWLRDSLPENVPGARIMVYGYNANVLQDVSTGRLRDQAANRPLILLAHSMGGLIIKQALLIANTRADGRFNSILNSVAGVIFLGTPHRGGNGVDTATFIANFIRAFKVNVRADLLKSLDPNSMVLFDLTDDFRQLVATKGIEIASLFETKKTKFSWPISPVWIVEEQSAILGTVGERKASINADHANLCKFKNVADSGLIATMQVIKEISRDVTPEIVALHPSSQPAPAPDGLKYTCLSDPEKLGSSDSYPVLVLGKYSYWALSYIDNRYAMEIVAYDSQKNLVGRWSKAGARYVQRIEYDEGSRQVKFVGQSSLSVAFGLDELKVTRGTRFG
uniref:D-xylose-proton symporter n=1 Tax=Ganoderma boninense TaxID=34458 RepID=A0A5K1K7N2_9APHY|nr:D-xylose-proton symporter [Ganoderma boninense]